MKPKKDQETMAQEGFKRKLTAILSADVAGYSRLMSQDWVALLTLALLQGSSQTQEEAGKAAAKEALSDQTFRDWLGALRGEARGKGISDATFSQLLDIKIK